MFQVYATDAIIATLMTCTRSVYPWDVVVIRKGSSLFFDKREKSDFDMLTVNENASEPPQDYFNLSSEATLIDKYFSQQVMLVSSDFPLNSLNQLWAGRFRNPITKDRIILFINNI